MKIKFIGATEDVTGSKHLLVLESGAQVLLDCGMYQGRGHETDEMNRKLDLDPSALEAVLLSHGHIDHCGSLPLLVKQGFVGKIYCTPATYDVCSILLLDSAHIQEHDVNFINKKRKRNGQNELKPIYTVSDAERCLEQFHPITFDTDHKLNDELSFYFSLNSHLIGSAAINVTAHEKGKITRLCFTGDIGRYSDPLLKPPAVFQQADYIICESTYGDRLHEPVESSEQYLLDVIKKTCIDQKGKVVIPAFSLGRTQEVLFLMDGLYNKGLLPKVKVYVDSPLSNKATQVVKKHPESYNDHLQQYIKDDPEPFGFSGLTYVEDVEASKQINASDEPCVIISASGMCDAGRVKHHLRYTISDPINTVLISGYCAQGTLGQRLLSGAKEVKIFGDLFEVKASITSIQSLSAHGDYKEMIRFLSCQHTAYVKTIFLVHGEQKTKIAWKATLEKEGYKKVVIPHKCEEFQLDPS